MACTSTGDLPQHDSSRRRVCTTQRPRSAHCATTSGAAPGIKHDGHWDLRPHAQRVELVDQVLAVWRDILDPELARRSPRETRMVYTVNREVAEALEQLARGDRLGGLGLQFLARLGRVNRSKEGTSSSAGEFHTRGTT